MAKYLDPAELNYVELSDSTTMPAGNAAPSPGGSSSSAYQLASESSPCERGRNKCSCCEKRKFDIIEGCMDEMVEAIDEFRDLYQFTEVIKRECKLPKYDVLVERIAKMNEEKEERLQKFMLEQQVAMAKMNEEKEERLQKFMLEQQVVMAKVITDAVKDALGRRLDSPAE